MRILVPGVVLTNSVNGSGIVDKIYQFSCPYCGCIFEEDANNLPPRGEVKTTGDTVYDSAQMNCPCCFSKVRSYQVVYRTRYWHTNSISTTSAL